MRLLAHTVVLLSTCLVSAVSAARLGEKPMLGWSSWNKYEYIAIDDCWQADARERETNKPLAHPDKFPSGFKNLTDSLHNLGFKVGIYSSAGTMTCQRRFGSLHYEEIDAKQYAEWGFDLLKYDNCYNEGLHGTPFVSRDRYKRMADALQTAGRTVWYYLCNWGEDSPWDWAYWFSQSYRIAGDVGDNYDRPDDNCPCIGTLEQCAVAGFGCSIMSYTDRAASVVHKSFVGSWADLDGLEVGNGGMTDDEYKTQFSLWALVKSPLMLGDDPKKTSLETLEIIGNKRILTINQDPAGRPAYRVWKESHNNGNIQLWRADIGGGRYALLLINSTPLKQRIEVKLREDFFRKEHNMRTSDFELQDLWADGKSLGHGTDILNLDVHSHGVGLLELVPAGQSKAALIQQF